MIFFDFTDLKQKHVKQKHVSRYKEPDIGRYVYLFYFKLKLQFAPINETTIKKFSNMRKFNNKRNLDLDVMVGHVYTAKRCKMIKN